MEGSDGGATGTSSSSQGKKVLGVGPIATLRCTNPEPVATRNELLSDDPRNLSSPFRDERRNTVPVSPHTLRIGADGKKFRHDALIAVLKGSMNGGPFSADVLGTLKALGMFKTTSRKVSETFSQRLTRSYASSLPPYESVFSLRLVETEVLRIIMYLLEEPISKVNHFIQRYSFGEEPE